MEKFLCVLLLVAGVAAQCPWAAGGLTTVTAPPAAWTISVPTLLDPAGPLSLTSITIAAGGELVFQNKDTVLDVDRILVQTGGALTIGSESCRFTRSLTVTLTGGTSSAESKAITAKPGSTVNIHGVSPSPVWTRLLKAIPKEVGASQLEEPVDWQKFDTIAFSGTDFARDEAEVVTVAGVHAAGRVVYHTRTAYQHWADDIVQGEVAKINRNIVVQGDDALAGGQIRVETPEFFLSGVELYLMGQLGVDGRFPIFFSGVNATATGAYVRDCSGHDMSNRFIVLVDTHGVTLENNVGLRTIGNMYALIEGACTNNVLHHNLGMIADEPTVPIFPAERDPAIFYVSHPTNDVTENAAYGSENGIRFQFPQKPILSSRTKYASDDTMWPLYSPAGAFRDNVVHGMRYAGFDFRYSLSTTGDYSYSQWEPQTGPYDVDGDGTAQYPVFNGGIAYKSEYCFGSNARRVQWQNYKLLDCKYGMYVYGSYQIFEDFLVVGDSDNIGTTNPDPMMAWSHDRTRIYTGYSNSGGIRLNEADDLVFRRFEFKNWNSNNLYKAAGIVWAQSNAQYPQTTFEEITFTNSEVIVTDGEGDGLAHGLYINDRDGSLTGVRNSIIVQSQWVANRLGNCVFNGNWAVYVCPPSAPMGMLRVDIEDMGAVDFGERTERFGWCTIREFGFDDELSLEADDDWNTPVVMGRGYDVAFPHPTPPDMYMGFTNSQDDEFIIMSVQYPPTATLTVTTNSARTSVYPEAESFEDMLVNPSWFYNAADERLYMRVESTYWGSQVVGDQQRHYVARYIYINADCGMTCTTTPRPVPAAVNIASSYRATLSGCGATPPVTTAHYAEAYILLQEDRMIATFQISHSLGLDVTEVQFVSIKDDRAEFVYTRELRSPIQDRVELSRRQHIGLFSGDWEIRLITAAHPTGEVVGQFGCVGSCKTPASILDTDPCAAGTLQIFDDTVDEEVYRFPNGGEGTIFATSEALCGTSVLRNNMTNYASLSSRYASALDDDWYPVPAGSTHFQFFIRRETHQTSTSRTQIVQIRGRAQDGTTTYPADDDYLNINDEYMENRVVDDTWTRVRVPLSAIGAPAAPFNLNEMRVRVIQIEDTPHMVYYFDNWGFVGGGGSLVAPTETVHVYTRPELCGVDDAISPTVVETSPAHGVAHVSFATEIEVVFSEAIDVFQDLSALVVVTDSAGAVPGTVVVDSPTVLRWVPDGPLVARDVHTVVVDGVLDAAGNAMAAPHELAFATVDSTHPTIIPFSVEHRYNDAEENEVGDVSLTSSDLDFHFVAENPDWVAVRYPAVHVPAGATIIEASVQFTNEGNGRAYTTMEIFGELNANSQMFEDVDFYITSLERTDTSVIWTGVADPLPQNEGLFLPWDWDYRGDRMDVQKTPDLMPVLQEIMDLPGWDSGSPVTLLFNTTQYGGDKEATSFDQNPPLSPRLELTVVMPGLPDTTPPSVVSQLPEEFAEVDPSTVTEVQIVFSEFMDPESSRGLILAAEDGTRIPLLDHTWTDFTTLEATLESPMLPAQLYCLTVIADLAMDLAGNAMPGYVACFNTPGYIDTSIPSVVSAVLPEAPGDALYLAFSERMSTTAVEGAFTVSLWRSASVFEPTVGEFAWNPSFITMTFNSSWEEDQIYIARITTAATDGAGTFLDAAQEWRFIVCEDAPLCRDPDTATPPEDTPPEEPLLVVEEGSGSSVLLIVLIIVGSCCCCVCCGAAAAFAFFKKTSDNREFTSINKSESSVALTKTEPSIPLTETSPPEFGSTPSPAAATMTPPAPVQSSRPLPPPPVSRRPPVPPPGKTALYDYESQGDGELSIAAGDRLTNIQDIGDGWSQGKNSAGEIGAFPTSYIQ